jgi:hypothetical protein
MKLMLDQAEYNNIAANAWACVSSECALSMPFFIYLFNFFHYRAIKNLKGA